MTELFEKQKGGRFLEHGVDELFTQLISKLSLIGSQLSAHSCHSHMHVFSGCGPLLHAARSVVTPASRAKTAESKEVVFTTDYQLMYSCYYIWFGSVLTNKI